MSLNLDPSLGLPMVYLVDDEDVVRDALAWLLRSRRLLSEGFASGDAFWQHVEERRAAPPEGWPSAPSCAVLDVRMPGTSGIELFERLVDAGLLNACPVIFLTGQHFGEDVFVTRKGAVSAKRGQLGIIPGSMGARSYIVRGLGNAESFESCSHGAGRVMSRTKAKKLFTVDDQIKATEGVECRKDKDVIDEIPMAYKDIDAVMEAQKDLVEVVHTLKQVVCVKG